MYNISKLKNGIRVVTEYIEYVRSVSVGVWVGAGSAMEKPENNGVSHYIEHMLFKGTTNRSARQLAEDMDRIGGQLNAVTSKEYTCYYSKALTEHWRLPVEILSDMLVNSTFTEENIATERNVIAEEISMCEDTPEDVVHDVLSDIFWDGDGLGFPIAGIEKTIQSIDKAVMLAYKDNFYCGENMVISVVGNFDQGEMLAELDEKFGNIPAKVKKPYIQSKIEVNSHIKIAEKDIEQCHICLGLECLARNDERIYDLLVINSIFGGNMSSRLFQRVREDMGLAYSIYSYANTYQKNGSMVIYAGLSPDKLTDALKIINDELLILKRDKLSNDEITVAKEQMKASVIMGLEGMSARMSSFGKAVLFDNKIRSLEETVKLIESVNCDSVAEVIDTVFDRTKLNIAVCGKTKASKSDIENIFKF